MISTHSLIKLLVGFVIVLAVAQAVPLAATTAQYAGERVMLMLRPSAERAYGYGMRHFDSERPAAYDIDRAEYFLRKTIELDPAYPLAHHQIARIEFLRGHFVEAIRQINAEIALSGDTYPAAYYVRGLVRGFRGEYSKAAEDFSHFLTLKPLSWPASNDLAWVLMKAGRYEEAARGLKAGLVHFPDNAWLLNSYAIALYEIGAHEEAAEVARRAHAAVLLLTPADWSLANPGNDPRIAGEGLATFRDAAIRNLEKISLEASASAIQ
jgi:tetratricopeptide (TPR) repeat protein